MSDDIRARLGLGDEGIAIEDRELREFIELTIELANKYIDFCKVMDKLGIPRDRSLKLVITDVGGEVGFIIRNCMLRPIIGIERATVEVYMPKDVFWAIVTKKLSLYDAWLYDLVRFRGENALRDAQILIPLFEALYDYIFGEQSG